MDEEIRHIDLCSGIGGFALATGWAGSRANRNVRTVCFSEIDPFCQAVLRHHWPGVPIIDDLRKFDYEGGCDLVTAGYPCQPFSVAGKQKGAADDRHLWPHVFEIVKRKRPAWCLFENVSGHVNLGLDEVLLDLENEGYAARPLVIPACAVDAPHRRDRVWIVGHTTHDRRNWGAEQAGREGTTDQSEQPKSSFRGEARGSSQNVADAKSAGSQARGRDGVGTTNRSRRNKGQSAGTSSKTDVADAKKVHGQSSDIQGSQQRQDKGSLGERSSTLADASGTRGAVGLPGQDNWKKRYAEKPDNGSDRRDGWAASDNWAVEPSVGRVAHGVPNRVAQLRALGNAIVPQVAAEIMEAMFRNWKGIDQ